MKGEGELTGNDETTFSGRIYLGAALLLWAVLTLTQLLTASPPSLLSQNQLGRLLPCDFILPILLFASGLRVQDSLKNRSGYQSQGELLGWISALLGAGYLLTQSSTTASIGEELVVVGTLTIASLVVAFLRGTWLAILSLALFAVAMIKADISDGPSVMSYSKGYLLPILFASFIARRDRNGSTISAQAFVWSMGALLMGVATPFSALQTTPSFVALSAAVGLMMLTILKKIRSPFLLHIGKAPGRLVILPTVSAVLCIAFFQTSILRLSIHWPLASTLAIGLLWGWSKVAPWIPGHVPTALPIPADS